MKSNPKHIAFMKKKITCDYLKEDDELSKGDCSIIREDFDESIIKDRNNN
jgi:hypothetical protein